MGHKVGSEKWGKEKSGANIKVGQEKWGVKSEARTVGREKVGHKVGQREKRGQEKCGKKSGA